MSLPENHPNRQALNDEVHARPSEPIQAPVRISYLALHTDWPLDERDWQPLKQLTERYETIPPRAGANHYSGDFGPFRLRWERHTEFTRYTFILPGSGANPFSDPPISHVPADWLENLPGKTLQAIHMAVVGEGEVSQDLGTLSKEYFSANVLIGSRIAEGGAMALTDFRLQGDRFSRMMIINSSMNSRQTGNMVQRLLEVDTYRLMALLALPVARQLTPFLKEAEEELVAITSAMTDMDKAVEPALLDRLTQLQSDAESRHASSAYRFSAADAYYALVQRRVTELREQRQPGLQTLQEFTDRRLAPAINTCRATVNRQDSLSRRLARATNLLSTRVDITRQQNSQRLLAAMNRRAKIQLRLQQTVEGLSVAAITYYIVGLVGYAAKAAHEAGLPVAPELVIGASIPVVIGLVGFGLHRARKKLLSAGDDEFEGIEE